jgi:hypothetical protein
MEYKSSREIVLKVSMEDVFSSNIDTYLQDQLSASVTGYHNGEGIVIPNTVQVISRSPLRLNSLEQGGDYSVIIRYSADILDAPNGCEFQVTVVSVISTGLICQLVVPSLGYPILQVYVPMTIHTDVDKERMRSIRVNDVIRVRSINRNGSIGEKTIMVMAHFVDLVKRGEDSEPVSKAMQELPAPVDEAVYDKQGDGDTLSPDEVVSL